MNTKTNRGIEAVTPKATVAIFNPQAQWQEVGQNWQISLPAPRGVAGNEWNLAINAAVEQAGITGAEYQNNVLSVPSAYYASHILAGQAKAASAGRW